jgi:hypothetical protein
MYIVICGNVAKLKYSSGKSEQRKLRKSVRAAYGPFTNTNGDNGSALLIKKKLNVFVPECVFMRLPLFRTHLLIGFNFFTADFLRPPIMLTF